ncbi:MAG: CDP-glucose 4,6-dehydratase [Negativicutes bacterium]|nr:CDP-glucose 4,6-dehydratase [Negativicutes bacterium]
MASRFKCFGGIYRGARVLVTGHTGFKGSWLCTWLASMGAIVHGFSLEPDTQPNHFDLIAPMPGLQTTIGDIRDLSALEKTWTAFQPEIVFHLAAQPLVRLSYDQPLETLHVNVLGTAHVLDVSRRTPSVRAMVLVTSDKCYENHEWVWGYRENDPMGGYDPYSASKGCAELVISAYRTSFFNPKDYGEAHHTLLASARAGNVIGGGDWGRDRIVTDIMLAAQGDYKLLIRNPKAIRPWQHVLEPLSGYLLLGQRLLEGHVEFAEGWNFGPNEHDAISVLDVVHHMQRRWPRIQYEISPDSSNLHEAGLLRLDCSKSRQRLNWRGTWSNDQAFSQTVQWYREFYERGRVLTYEQLTFYLRDAMVKGISWIEPVDQNV